MRVKKIGVRVAPLFYSPPFHQQEDDDITITKSWSPIIIMIFPEVLACVDQHQRAPKLQECKLHDKETMCVCVCVCVC